MDTHSKGGEASEEIEMAGESYNHFGQDRLHSERLVLVIGSNDANGKELNQVRDTNANAKSDSSRIVIARTKM